MPSYAVLVLCDPAKRGMLPPRHRGRRVSFLLKEASGYPVWSSNRARHRLSRTGNRQLNAAPHRIAMTQAIATR